MVVNMNMRSEKEDAINDYLCDTIASVFEQTMTARVRGGTNTELFASDNPGMVALLEERIQAMEEDSLRWQMERVVAGLEEKQGGDKILSDDKAPVEVLGMKVLDETIAKELAYYKDIIKSGEWEQFFN